MPRKGPAPRRELLPDPIYHSALVTQLVNKVLSRGKRSLAEQIVYDALETIKERTSVDVKPRRATTLSVRWLVGYSRQRREKTMSLRLASELLDASNGVGAAVKRREDMHKMAESNKAFAHYRW
jgi:small subunit ribosomal protein S7